MKKLQGKVKIVGLLLAGAIICVGGIALIRQVVMAEVAAPQTVTADQVASIGKYPFQYSVKFVCGLQKPSANGLVRETPVKPGNYATAVNVHNPARLNFGTTQFGTALMLKKAVIALPEPDQGKPSAFHNQELLPDGATEIDCPEIRNILGTQGGVPEQFMKGFFVIYSSKELDVVGVYTGESLDSAGAPNGITMDVEYIPVRKF